MYANEPGEAAGRGEPTLNAGESSSADADPMNTGAGAAGDAASLARELAQARAALAAAEATANDRQDQLLRTAAEMENVRRRAREDVAKAHKYAVESFAESMLPVRDSLEMALTVPAPTIESLREGVEATLRQIVQAFDRNRVIVIDPLNQKFDPNQQQAISMVPSNTVPANHVVAVLQKGYLINDRILRPALVTVSQGG